MKTATFFAVLVSAFSASAAPTSDATGSRAFLRIQATTALGNGEFNTRQLSIPLFQLNTYRDLSVTKLELVNGQEIPEDRIECRAYQDTKGLLPGSLPFSGGNPAYIATNPEAIGGILCYPTKAIPDV